MTKVSTSDGKLVIDVKGLHKLWALKSRLEIPLEHVSGVRHATEERVTGIRSPGTYVPGLISAGTFYQSGKKVFWDVHNFDNAIAIDLYNESYTSLIIEVSDPQASIREIQDAITPASV